MLSDQLIVRDLGLLPYEPTWQRMQSFTNERGEDVVDEIWSLQHEPVFTQGQAGKEEHLLNTGDIPVVQVDRGGQVTYHGPGQAIIYLMLNLKRKKLGVRELVSIMEEAVVDTLNEFQIDAYPKPDAPGVYVEGSKIASLGLRVRRGCSFHGLALNLAMDLEPFLRINPCGYAGMEMTQLGMLVEDLDQADATQHLLNHLISKLGYAEVTRKTTLD
ncbi:lipoyl(octanoyl) transferase LipB [Neptuniibacter sp. 1_MG-2023]|uniref:lipoyl(octanoyl) transferase LipB n=1 Tax=Neptuniibacter sp. 1_MG-2023 TaxID=3062662 RepID=UPI0026E427B1|nr:lipoyl(octanoyl) transferase LipB [Neptuniibacter sp. 1_MG-2023]MDO6593334.1 lipoyl(octanoyl) transferase LipB [Neptuniibacter sp. 1_MG-2023]